MQYLRRAVTLQMVMGGGSKVLSLPQALRRFAKHFDYPVPSIKGGEAIYK